MVTLGMQIRCNPQGGSMENCHQKCDFFNEQGNIMWCKLFHMALAQKDDLYERCYDCQSVFSDENNKLRTLHGTRKRTN